MRTIYPPVAEAWFAAVYRLAGIDARHKAWQVAGLVGDMALVGLLPAVLRAWKRDERWTALYALSPVAVVEVVNNAHVDGLAALFVVLALLGRGPPPAGVGRRPASARRVLVKLYPAVLSAWRSSPASPGAGHSSAWPAPSPASWSPSPTCPTWSPSASTCSATCPATSRRSATARAGRFLLAGLLGLPPALTATLAAAGLAAAAGWVLVRRPEVARGCAVLLGALLLAVTPVQPWYAVTLLAVATVAAAPAWSAVALAGYPYFFAVILDAPHAVAIGRVSYGLALAVLVAGRWKYSLRHSERSNDADRAAIGDRGAGDDGVHGVRG